MDRPGRGASCDDAYPTSNQGVYKRATSRKAIEGRTSVKSCSRGKRVEGRTKKQESEKITTGYRETPLQEWLH